MKQISIRDMEKILDRNGYRRVRTNGSHSIWKTSTNTISLPVVQLKSVVANRIIKENHLTL